MPAGAVFRLLPQHPESTDAKNPADTQLAELQPGRRRNKEGGGRSFKYFFAFSVVSARDQQDAALLVRQSIACYLHHITSGALCSATLCTKPKKVQQGHKTAAVGDALSVCRLNQFRFFRSLCLSRLVASYRLQLCTSRTRSVGSYVNKLKKPTAKDQGRAPLTGMAHQPWIRAGHTLSFHLSSWARA